MHRSAAINTGKEEGAKQGGGMEGEEGKGSVGKEADRRRL